jgi:hypothetical protein
VERVPTDQFVHVLLAGAEQVNALMQRLSHHFEMLCFADKKLPWYLTAYKWVLYGVFWLYQQIRGV